MNRITHEHGMLCIGLPGGEEFTPLGVIDGAALVEAYEDYDGVKIHELITTAQEEATFTVKLTKEQCYNFFNMTFGLEKTVLDCVREDFTGRIPHLATYARKHRTRKKNLHRAFRILEREV